MSSDSHGAPEIRVLVIDDSAYNRQAISSMLEATPEIRVVATAGDGDEGLKQVFAFAPDVITLDLEMPKMDGFAFLRILMSRRPTPVLVISSYARRENVFKALELGALDFIAKPSKGISPDLRLIERDLVEKVRLVNKLRMISLTERAQRLPVIPPAVPADGSPDLAAAPRLIVCGASTGGPPALQQIFSALDPRLPIALLVAQHMPAKFTTAFAERLDRASAIEVREARTGDAVRPGLGLVAPGAGIMRVVRASDGWLRTRIDAPTSEDRFVPSIDRLFESAAEVMGQEVLGVILTGMAGDGARGAKAIQARGGMVVAETPETAVIAGMPEEAIRSGAVAEVLPLGQIAAAIARFARR
ncbi:MAG: chemotaxis-specific protein-glutamate methyltransferase CheB [Pseudomonadota bacterium]